MVGEGCSGIDASGEGGQAAQMFTSRLWAVFGVTCLLTIALGALLLHDVFSAAIFGLPAASYLFVCFLGLTLLSFVPRPPVRNPAAQIGVFTICLALSGLTYAAGSAAVLPLLGQPAEFDFYPAYYLYCLPVLGLAILAIAVIHLLLRSRSPRVASATPDHTAASSDFDLDSTA